MSRVEFYRQYWMATLRDRNCCQICGELAINALEYLDKHCTYESISWFCDQHLPVGSYSEIQGVS